MAVTENVHPESTSLHRSNWTSDCCWFPQVSQVLCRQPKLMPSRCHQDKNLASAIDAIEATCPSTLRTFSVPCQSVPHQSNLALHVPLIEHSVNSRVERVSSTQRMVPWNCSERVSTTERMATWDCGSVSVAKFSCEEKGTKIRRQSLGIFAHTTKLRSYFAFRPQSFRTSRICVTEAFAS